MYSNTHVMTSHCNIVRNSKRILQAKPFPRHFNVMDDKKSQKSFVVNSAEETFTYLTTDVRSSCISFLTSPHR